MPVEWLFADVGPILQNQLRSCHSLMRIVTELMAQSHRVNLETDPKFLQFMKDLFSELVVTTNREIAAEIIGKRFLAASPLGEWQIALERAANYSEFVTKDAVNFYFNVAHGIQEKGWATFQMAPLKALAEKRIEVIDLASIGDATLRAIVSNLAISRAWQAARKDWERALTLKVAEDRRVPTFIVIDDVQDYTLAGPNDPFHRRSLELLRAIAAEGRKFGVFLIVMTPRPDALDPFLIAECENRAIMRIGSPPVLDRAADLLGFSGAELGIARRCLEFSPGLALLFGPWTGRNPAFLYSGPRRTLDGSRSLQASHWARP